MKKRILSLLLAAVMVLAVTGCGSKDSDQNDTPDTEQGTEDTTEPETPAEPETPVEPETPAEPETPDAEIAFPATDETLDAIYTDVVAAYGDNYVATMPCDTETINAVFGISSDLYTEGFAYMPMVSQHADKFFGFKAAEGKSEDLLAAVTAYQDTLKADTMQYPSNLAKIQASQVVVKGDYVFFVLLGFIENEEQDEAGLIADYTAQNQIAIDVIEEAIQ